MAPNEEAQLQMATLLDPFQVYGDFANFMAEDPLTSAFEFDTFNGTAGLPW